MSNFKDIVRSTIAFSSKGAIRHNIIDSEHIERLLEGKIVSRTILNDLLYNLKFNGERSQMLNGKRISVTSRILEEL